MRDDGDIPLHSQKMEIMGRMTGVVIHELNNLLTVIQLNAALLEVGEGDEASQAIAREIVNACEQAASLTRGVLGFSRRNTTSEGPFEILKALEDVVRFAAIYVKKKTTLSTEFCGGEAWVYGDRSAVSQAVINLIFNAVDASPRDGIVLGVRSGDTVEIFVRDTGTGIPQELTEKIFEPYFTTKKEEKGTGLGLAVVRRVAERHGGSVAVSSEMGAGTEFCLRLPKIMPPESQPVAQSCPRREMCGGVLVVEDDPGIRNLVLKILREGGCRLYEAGTAAEAERVWEEHRGEISLLLTDLVLPGGGAGDDIARKFQDAKPGLKTIFMSGNASALRRNSLPLEANFLSKPFSPQELVRRVSEVLDN